MGQGGGKGGGHLRGEPQGGDDGGVRLRLLLEGDARGVGLELSVPQQQCRRLLGPQLDDVRVDCRRAQLGGRLGQSLLPLVLRLPRTAERPRNALCAGRVSSRERWDVIPYMPRSLRE